MWSVLSQPKTFHMNEMHHNNKSTWGGLPWCIHQIHWPSILNTDIIFVHIWDQNPTFCFTGFFYVQLVNLMLSCCIIVVTCKQKQKKTTTTNNKLTNLFVYHQNINNDKKKMIMIKKIYKKKMPFGKELISTYKFQKSNVNLVSN